MRIAMFTNNYKPYVGGVPISIEHLAAALRELGHTVYVFAPSYENQSEEEFVIRYPVFPVKISDAPIPNVLTKLFLKKVAELQIDVIHVHHPAIVGNVALLIRRKLGIPVVFTYHTRYEEYLHYIKPLQKFEEHTGIIELYLKNYCNRCDMIVAPTPGIRRHLICDKNVDAPIGVMPTGIPEENYVPEPGRVAEIKRRYRSDVDYMFCTVSRLAEEKNLMFQLKGLADLKELLQKEGKTFCHLMIGEGPQRTALAQRIKELGLEQEVQLIGNVENHEIKNYQAASDLFLFTSKSETQGIVLLEAMAVGNPVIAVAASGVCDMIESGKNGILTIEDASKWAQAIKNILGDTYWYENMCREAKKTAQGYSEMAVAEQAATYYFNTCIRYRNEFAKVPLRRHYMVQ